MTDRIPLPTLTQAELDAIYRIRAGTHVLVEANAAEDARLVEIAARLIKQQIPVEMTEEDYAAADWEYGYERVLTDIHDFLGLLNDADISALLKAEREGE